MKLIRYATLAIAFVSTLFAQDSSISRLKESAERGDAQAQLRLAILYVHGTGVDQDEAQAARWLKAAATQGNAQAQNELGLLYRFGHGVELDKTAAVGWWRKAAAQENPPGLFNLGTAYFNGDGVAINDELAYAWFGLAARAGDSSGRDALQRMEKEHSPVWLAFARFKMAEMLEKGEGIPADLKAAKSIYESVSATNIPEDGIRSDAQLKIAQMYMDGRGVVRDFQAAKSHCEDAAKLKSLRGMFCLGKFAEGDYFGPPDYKQAAHYYEQAAKFGDGLSMISLGRLCENGLGVKQDKIRALSLYLIGEGHTRSTPPLSSDRLAATMKDSDIEKSRKKAKDWHVRSKLP
jgi:uncharacterized protein